MKTVRVVTEIAALVETFWAEVTAVGQYAVRNPFITAFRPHPTRKCRPGLAGTTR
jgi:hypothetical protein